MRLSFFLGILFMLLSLQASAQQLGQRIDNAFQSFTSLPSLRNGIAGFAVMDSKTGQMIYERNSHLGLPTASTLKTITSITALDILGADYAYKTSLYYTGQIDSLGTLHGDIIIEGMGDPTLGSDRFASTKAEDILQRWVISIKELGIDSIAGRIIADDRLYNGHDVPGTWMWTDMGNYYGAGISTLNWQENKIGIRFTPGNVGQPARTRDRTDDISYLDVVNEVRTGAQGSGDQVYAYSAPYSNTIYLRGTYGRDLNKTIEISLPDPANHLAYSLQKALVRTGISTSGDIKTGKALADYGQTFGTQKKLLSTHTSPTLSEIVHWFNQKSINLYGEALLKSIAFISSGETGSKDGASLLTKYWQQKLSISTGELRLHDGSGLSPQTRVTPQAMLRIMHYARSRPWFADFHKSLPIIHNMSMKSGTIGGVLGYTGYQRTSAGQELTFVLLVNNYEGSATAMRQQMFKLLDVLKQ